MENIKFEKKINKRLIGAVIGSAILGVGGYSMTPKGKSFWKKIKEKTSGIFGFLKVGINEIKKTIKK